MTQSTTPVSVTSRDMSWQFNAPDDHIGRLIRQSGRPYEEDLLDALAVLLAPGDLVVDVGANIGNHTVYFAVACQARVEAFEPNDEARKCLASNVALNHLERAVTLHEQALSDHIGRGSIVNPRDAELGTGTSVVVADSEGDVETARLADQPFSQVRLVKIDVEGAEEAVIRGGMDLLRHARPVVVAESDDPEQRERIEGLLRPLGYRRFPVQFAFTPTWVYLPRVTDFIRLAVSPTVRRRVRRRLVNRFSRPS